MKHLIPIAIAAFLFTGCASFQGPVDDTLLAEMTQEEKDQLSKIGNDIMAKKVEKDSVETALAISEQKIVVNEAQIRVLNEQKELYIAKDKLYSLSNDNNQLAQTRKIAKDNDTLSLQYGAYKDYCKAKRNTDKALFDVKSAELAVLVAKLDFEKAKIALEFQKRRGDAKKDLIDPKKYEEYMKQQQNSVASEQANHKKASEALLVADSNLSKTGFGGQK